MIDDSDGDFVSLIGVVTPGWLGVIILLIGFGLWYVACQNKAECAELHCDTGKPVLAHHQCVCETLAK